MSVEAFRCVRLGCSLTRSSCAARHRSVKRDAAGGTPAGQRSIANTACPECPVGLAHARGEQPDRWGPAEDHAPLELVQLVSAATATTKGPAAAQKGPEIMPKPQKVLTVRGEKLTYKELSVRSGISVSTLKSRHFNGWSDDRLDEPVGAVAQKTVEVALRRVNGAKRPKTPAPAAAVSRYLEGDGSAAATAELVRELLRSVDPAVLLTRLGHTPETLGDPLALLEALGYPRGQVASRVALEAVQGALGLEERAAE